MRPILKLALVAATVLVPMAAQAEFPEKPVTIVVPSAPGGGGDMVARTLLRLNEERNGLGVPIVVQNSPGGGGAVASRQVLAAEPDGYTILALHQGLITANVLGVTDFGPEAFEPVAQVVGQCVVYAAAPNSPYATYDDLVAAAKSGTRIREAANIGAVAHFASMMLNNAAGIEVSVVQAGQGSERLASLMGGHTDVSIFTVAEVLAYAENGVTGLAILTDERDPALPDVATAAEQGYDVEFCIGNWLMAPKGTPPEVIATLVEGLETMLDDDAVRAEWRERGFDPRLITGDDFKTLIDQSTATITELGANIPR